MSNEESKPPILTKPPIIKKSGGKFRKLLGWVSRFFVGLLILVFATWLLGHLTHWARLTKQNDKIKVITELSSLKYPEDFESAKRLCTDQGYTLLQDLVSGDGLFPPASFEVTDVKISGQFCDVGMNRNVADGQSYIYVRLVNQNGWKFHDILLVTRHGNKIGLWYSYIHEHPLITFGQIYAPEIKSASDSVQSIANSVREWKNSFGEIRNLFEGNNSAPETDAMPDNQLNENEQAEILQQLTNQVQSEDENNDDDQ